MSEHDRGKGRGGSGGARSGGGATRRPGASSSVQGRYGQAEGPAEPAAAAAPPAPPAATPPPPEASGTPEGEGEESGGSSFDAAFESGLEAAPPPMRTDRESDEDKLEAQWLQGPAPGASHRADPDAPVVDSEPTENAADEDETS